MAAGLMNTDQQVIYAMFNTMPPRTKLQLYSGDGRYDGWFHLGYISRESGLQHRADMLRTTTAATPVAANITRDMLTAKPKS